jgi:tRNA pseudouridine38-40 synthase
MRLAMGVSYLGSAYEGWQSQSSGRTVQDHLEKALGQFCCTPVRTLCAGRTDAGVHGLMQVVQFDTLLERPASSWMRGTNRYLPHDIAVQWAQAVPPEFHCRASAKTRRYAYVLLQSPVRPSVDHGRVGWSLYPLQEEPMRQALSPVKTLLRIDIRKRGAYWVFEFEASAFLHHMIRNIMGCLVSIGQGRKSALWMQEVLDARSREVAAPTFSPNGLYFLGPTYDAKWGLPAQTPPFDFLP